MSIADSVTTQLQARRRFHARRRIGDLCYVEFGADNGAILIDLGEGGLGFQSVMPVSMNQALPFKFKLPSESNYIEGSAEVAWMNESGKGGGLRFVELTAEARAHLREWSGVLSAPEAGGVHGGNGTHPNSAPERATADAPADPVQESVAPAAILEPINGAKSPAPVSEVFPSEENIQSAKPEATSASHAEKGAHEEKVAADDSTLAEAPAVPEFVVEAARAPDAEEPLAIPIELPLLAPPLAPVASTQEVPAPEPTPSAKAVHGDSADPVRIAANPEIGSASRPNRSAHRISEMARAAERPETAAAPPAPAKPARLPASDEKNLAPVQKRLRKQVPPGLESPLTPASRQDSALRGSFVRQTRKPWPTPESENLPAGQSDELSRQAAPVSQALKTGLGAVAGALLMLALAVSVPSLRTRVQAIAPTARSSGADARPPEFQVEVADINNRRWILKSGGEAGSPFADGPSRRETASAGSSRTQSTKSSRTDDSENSSDTASVPQPKLATPAQLTLSHPHTTEAAITAAQIVAPSIFDGITPPIGSVSDALAVGGPQAPGIVEPERQPGVRASALQAAVLVQRVEPIYPRTAQQSRLRGDVQVNATIGQDGVPKNLKVIRGSEVLIPAALAAIRQWRYRPATLGGQPIETQVVVTINFQLN